MPATMRVTPDVIICVMFLVLGGIWWRQGSPTPPKSMHNVSDLLNMTQLRVYTILDSMASEVHDTMQTALHDLFIELDKNGVFRSRLVWLIWLGLVIGVRHVGLAPPT